MMMMVLSGTLLSAPCFAYDDEEDADRHNPWSRSYESPYDKMRQENRSPFYEESLRRDDRNKVEEPKRDRSDDYSYNNARKPMTGGEVISNMLRERR